MAREFAQTAEWAKGREEDIVRWLENFESDHRTMALQLLGGLRVYTTHRLKEWAGTLHRFLLLDIEGQAEQTRYVGLGAYSESSCLVAYYYRSVNKIPLEFFINPDQAHDGSFLAANGVRALVFLDDFIGSGNQAVKFWKSLVESWGDDANRPKLLYSAFVACREGKAKVEENTGFEVHVVRECDKAFGKASTVFPDEKREEARRTFERYGKLLFPKHPLGYGDGQALVVFDHNTPNNTLPVIWSDAEGWFPLFERCDKATLFVSKVAARGRFLEYAREEHRFLPLRGFGTELRAPIELEPVYISLRAVPSHMEIEMRHKKPEDEAQPIEEMEIGAALGICQERGYSGLAILGDPGSGKTTLLKYLALCLAQSKPVEETGVPPGRLPIYLPLRAVTDFNASLAQALRDYYPMSEIYLPPDFFEGILGSERCLLLLDGVDEVATSERRREATEWIERARKAHPNNLIIVTSRFAGYKGSARLPANYLEMHVRDLNDDDVQQFVKQWYLQVETKQRGDTEHWRNEARRLSDDFITQLSRQERVRQLAKNPLMLQIICLLHRTQGSMPKRQTELYEECIRVLLQKWDEAKGLEVFLSAAEARQVLRPLALWLHSEESRTFADTEQVKEIVRPHLARVKRLTRGAEEQLDRILTSVRDRSGLFVGYDVTRYGFQHLSFQEFLAAEEIVKQRLHKRLVETFGQSWWREPTLLSLGLDDPHFQAGFFRTLVRSSLFCDNLDFGLACVRELLAPSVVPFADAIADPKLDSRGRYNCVMLLREIGGAEAIEALEEAYKNPDPKIATAAHDALVQLGALEEEKAAAPTVGAESFVNEIDATELIRIPAGEFTMGTDRERERPQRPVYLDEYYMAKHPVTNAQYARFIKATGHERPRYWHSKRYNKPNQPVVTVTWDDAKAYCEWAGLRLPTEAEWEKAARGTDGPEWPWGNEKPDEKRCNFGDNVGTTSEIGSFPDGASPYGCMDMAGNVWEWCEDWYDEYRAEDLRNPTGPTKGNSKVLRGGAYYFDPDSARCASRGRGGPDVGTGDFGFRCAR